MNFIVLGGGCFGTFYARQLLRAKNLSFEKIIVVDVKGIKNPCQAFQELGEGGGKIQYVFSDWKEFFYPYLDQKINEAAHGKVSRDHYIPPTFAPHVLMEAFLNILQKRFPEILIRPEPMSMVADQKLEGQPSTLIKDKIQIPFHMLLPSGNLALSFSTWICPATCIEPPTCPVTRGPKDWDMKTKILESMQINTNVDYISVLQCRHLTMGVGTIPVQEIVNEYLKFQEVARVPGTHGLTMASVSSCHGLVGRAFIQHGEL